MKNILITGGFGFIGFNAVVRWSKQMPETNFIILDSFTYAAKFMLIDKLAYISKTKNVFYYTGGIESADILEIIYKKFKIDAIVNFAAETHVDNSISGPKIFFETNVIGTANLLEFARRHDIRFHQISTDEVYKLIARYDIKNERGKLIGLRAFIDTLRNSGYRITSKRKRVKGQQDMYYLIEEIKKNK